MAKKSQMSKESEKSKKSKKSKRMHKSASKPSSSRVSTSKRKGQQSAIRRAAKRDDHAHRVGRLLFSGPVALAIDERTCAGHVFAETSVLSKNADKLKQARRFIAGVAYKRGGSGMAAPRIPTEEELENPNTKAIWERCEAAAKNAQADDVQACKHFVIWFSDDDGKTPSKTPARIPDDWPYSHTDKIAGSWGPFTSPIEPRGSNIYVIKYCGVP